MSSGATYSPGAWFALVSPSSAILVDPELPSERLDELWQVVQHGEGPDHARSVIRDFHPRVLPSFALAMVNASGVLLMIRGRIGVTVQGRDGGARQVVAPVDGTIHEEQVAVTDTVWFVRPGAPADGVALPIVGAAVLADVLAWQPMAGLDGWRAVAEGRRTAQVVGAVPVAPRGREWDVPGEVPAVVPAAVEALPAAAHDAGSVIESQPVVAPAAHAAAAHAAEAHRGVGTGPRRLSPDEIRATAGRTTAGLGSHRRRRYGAWDWSLPEQAGAGAAVPQARNGSAGRAEGPARHEAPYQDDEPARIDDERIDRHPVGDVLVDADDSAMPAAAATAEPVVATAEGDLADLDAEGDRGADAEQLDEVDQLAEVEYIEEEPEPEPVRHGVLEFSDGQRVEVTGPVIIGRAPSQATSVGDRPAQLVALTAAGRGVSRNHLRIDIGLTGLFAVDLGSRNGSILHVEGEPPVTLDAWMPYELEPGMRLGFATSSCLLVEAEEPSISSDG